MTSVIAEVADRKRHDVGCESWYKDGKIGV
jgi:hypothetical protein